MLLLAGCLPGQPLDRGDPSADSPGDVSGGMCIAHHDGGLDARSAVPCTEPHEWEVLGILSTLPPEFAEADFEALTDDAGKLRADVLAYGLRECSPFVSEWSGLGDTVGEVPIFAVADAILWPVIDGSFGVVLPSSALWRDHPVLYCTVQWTDDEGFPMNRAANSEEPLLASYARGAQVGSWRQCLIDGEEQVFPEDCDATPHSAQWLFSFDATAVFGAAWTDAVDPRAITDEQRSDLDDACASASPAVFGGSGIRDDLRLQGDAPLAFWGQSPLGPDFHQAGCVVRPIDPETLIAGRVWGLGDQPARLVPVG